MRRESWYERQASRARPMETMMNGRRIGADSRPSRRWEAALRRAMKFRSMRSGSLTRTRSRRRRGRVTLRQMRGDDLVDLGLRVRLESYRNTLIFPAALNDDPERPDVARGRKHALEIVHGRARHVLSVHRDQTVARLEPGALGGTIRHDRFDHDPRLQIHNGEAEITAAAHHLPDLLFAFFRRRIAVLRFIGERMR